MKKTMKTLLALLLLIPSLSWSKITDQNFKYHKVYVCGELFNEVNYWDRFNQSAFDLEVVQFLYFDLNENVVVQWGHDMYKSWESISYPHLYNNNAGVKTLDIEKVGSNIFVMNFISDRRGFELTSGLDDNFYYQLIFDRRNLTFESNVYKDDQFPENFIGYEKAGKCVLQYTKN